MSTIPDQIKLLFRLYRQPAGAMSRILDQGSLLFASAMVVIITLLLRTQAFSFYTPLLILAVFYVPGTLLIARWIGGLGSTLQRDYSPLLTCAAMAWSAANLPLAAISRLLPPAAFAGMIVATYLYFAVLMFFAVRTVLGVSNTAAGWTVCLSWLPLLAAYLFWGPIQYVMGWVASPFFLFFAYYYLGGELSNLGAGFRQRQNFRRMLEAATVNPHDAESRYQLGLIYQERRQYTEAIQQFKAAVSIDAKETDAHFQLGRIALEQSRLKDAFGHLQTVVEQDEKHHSHEILRELGRMYIMAKQFEDARRELAAYTEKRPYDPEGLFYYGQALERTGAKTEAAAVYTRTMEAAAAAPHYRRRQLAQWSRLAQKQAAKLATGLLLLVLLPLAKAQQPDIHAMTARLSEEAEVFSQAARAVLSQETLTQRARKPAPRVRLRIGAAATAPPKEEFLTREIISEYGYASFKDSPAALHEFRQVISVDGRQVLTREKARRTLTLGVRSADDNVKKQMLKDFEKHGLTGAATDFGQLILLFTKRRLPNYQFELAGQDRLGADTAAMLSFRQYGGNGALTTFAGREALRTSLQGTIWLRMPDHLPLRIRLRSERREGEYVVKTEATVDYAMSPHGFILPAAVAHREMTEGKLLTENIFQYTPFRKFGAESELKFTDVP